MSMHTPADEPATRRRIAVRPSAAVQVLSDVWNHPANRSRRFRAMWRALRFQIRTRLSGRPVIVEFAHSSRVSARLDGAGSQRAAYAAFPDWNEMTAWLRHLRAGDRFIDVGANVGLYSLLAAEAGCSVTALEPFPDSREQLEQNNALNGYGIEILEVALADRAGTMLLAGQDALRQHLVVGGTDQGLVVAVQTLDEVLGDGSAAGVKIDVEGAERLVLEGGRRALSERRIALLQLEWNQTAERNFGESRAGVVALLEASGYELCRPDADGTLWPAESTDEGADMFARPAAEPAGFAASPAHAATGSAP